MQKYTCVANRTDCGGAIYRNGNLFLHFFFTKIHNIALSITVCFTMILKLRNFEAVYRVSGYFCHIDLASLGPYVQYKCKEIGLRSSKPVRQMLCGSTQVYSIFKGRLWY